MDVSRVWSEMVAYFAAHAVVSASLGGISVFDGCGSMSKAMNDHNIPALGFEVKNDPTYQDCLTMEGAQYFVMMLVRVTINGIIWLGPPCCSWIWMTRSKSKRTRQCPAGARGDAWVDMHNKIADFVAQTIKTCHERGVFYVIEQPQSSLLFDYRPVAEALAATGGRSVSVRLGDFGSASAKPLRLMGTAPWMDGLADVGKVLRGKMGMQPKTTLATRHEHSVTGRRGIMEESSAYPDAFAHHVARLHTEYLQQRLLGCELARLHGKREATELEDHNAEAEP